MGESVFCSFVCQGPGGQSSSITVQAVAPGDRDFGLDAFDLPDLRFKQSHGPAQVDPMQRSRAH